MAGCIRVVLELLLTKRRLNPPLSDATFNPSCCLAHRAGAALDVLEKEPPGDELEALKKVPNLILTPHIGWASRQARQRLVTALAEALESEIGGWS